MAVSAQTLQDGVDWVQDTLGVGLAQGGRHAHMATHNRLLGLGDIYLEVIAADPVAPAPDWPRWFDLDHFAGQPRLTNWIAACDDLDAEIALSPAGTGRPANLTRGDLRWRMAVPEDGELPYDGCFPALIAWQGAHHPTQVLPDMGVRLDRLEIAHPRADDLARQLAQRLKDARIIFVAGKTKEMRAIFSTPFGPRVLA